jgi:hypothetical protein
MECQWHSALRARLSCNCNSCREECKSRTHVKHLTHRLSTTGIDLAWPGLDPALSVPPAPTLVTTLLYNCKGHWASQTSTTYGPCPSRCNACRTQPRGRPLVCRFIQCTGAAGPQPQKQPLLYTATGPGLGRQAAIKLARRRDSARQQLAAPVPMLS